MLTAKLQNLVLEYLSFADQIAKNQFKKTPPQVSLDELKSAAYLGLVDAATRYNGDGNFQAFSCWRIRGEIKDYLRSLRWNTNEKKVSSIDEYDIPAEPEPDNFDEILDGIHLTGLAKSIFKMYYGEGLIIMKIAEKVDLSGARISQILKTNLELLRS